MRSVSAKDDDGALMATRRMRGVTESPAGALRLAFVPTSPAFALALASRLPVIGR